MSAIDHVLTGLQSFGDQGFFNHLGAFHIGLCRTCGHHVCAQVGRVHITSFSQMHFRADDSGLLGRVAPGRSTHPNFGCL